jgi:peptidoglycan/xylan/chitin deacetylase (PgdA/CDA1 family)
MDSDSTDAAALSLGPRWLYPAKAALTRSRAVVWHAGRRRKADGMRFLFYHRVADERDELAVRVDRFRRQMDALASAGYEAVGIPEALRRLHAGEAVDRCVSLSFDDGFRDVAENGAPILAEHGFSATVFVATEVTSGRASFPWYAQQPPLLDWEEIRRLDGEGVLGFEAHTLTHPKLTALDEEEARTEIVASKQALEQELGRPVTAFCYPAGVFGDRERALAAAAGFTSAVSCDPGINTATSDVFALHRIQIDHRDGLLEFRAKLGGGFDTPLPLRAIYRRLRY